MDLPASYAVIRLLVLEELVAPIASRLALSRVVGETISDLLLCSRRAAGVWPLGIGVDESRIDKGLEEDFGIEETLSGHMRSDVVAEEGEVST